MLSCIDVFSLYLVVHCLCSIFPRHLTFNVSSLCVSAHAEGVNQLQQRASKPTQHTAPGTGPKDHGPEVPVSDAAADWPAAPAHEIRKPVESGTIVPERDSRVGVDAKSHSAASASETAFDRFESLDISSTEGEAVKFSDSEEDTTSEPVVIQPLTR
jgi:hypothetical protein